MLGMKLRPTEEATIMEAAITMTMGTTRDTLLQGVTGITSLKWIHHPTTVLLAHPVVSKMHTCDLVVGLVTTVT